MKKTLGILFGVIATVLVGTGFYIEDEIKVSIPETEAQAKLNEQIPLEIKKLGFTANVTALKIDFLEDNTINIQSVFDVTGQGMTVTGTSLMNTGVRYDNGNFYVTKVDPKSFKLDKTKSNNAVVEDAKAIASGVWKKLKNKVVEKDDTLAKKALDRIKEKYTPVIKEKVEGYLIKKVQETPIYSLNGKDIKHSMAALALQDIQFKESSLEVTLSPFKLLGSLAMYVLAGILYLLMVFAFIRSGGAGFGAAAVGSLGD